MGLAAARGIHKRFKDIVALIGAYFRESPGPLGRWCRLDTNPVCDPMKKADFANLDNSMDGSPLRHERRPDQIV